MERTNPGVSRLNVTSAVSCDKSVRLGLAPTVHTASDRSWVWRPGNDATQALHLKPPYCSWITPPLRLLFTYNPSIKALFTHLLLVCCVIAIHLHLETSNVVGT